MRYGFINNFSQALAADLTAGATTMTLDGGGALLADASTDYRYKLTLVQTDAFGNETHREIVDVTAASGDTLTIERQQEGTTQLAPWPSGTKVYARVTGAHLKGFAPETIAFGPVDFSNATSSASWVAPPGRKIYVDDIDVVPTDSGKSGAWADVAGTPTMPGRSWGVARSPDGALLAVVHSTSPYLTVINVADWTVVTGTPTLAGTGRAVHFSPDGTKLAVAHSISPFLTVINVADWTVVTGTPTLAGTGLAVRYSSDGTKLAVGHDYGDSISVFNVADWTAITIPVLPNSANSVGWRHDDSQLAAAHYDSPNLTIYETATWTVVSGTPTPPFASFAVAYNADSTLLAVGHMAGNTLQVYNTNDWTAIDLPDMPSAGTGTTDKAYSLDWNPINGNLAVGHSGDPDNVSILDNTSWTLQGNPSVEGSGFGIVYKSDGDTLYIAHADTPFFTAATITPYPAPTINLGSDATNNNNLLAAAALETFVADQRVSLAVNAKPGQATLYAEPGTANDAGAPAMIVVRGYTMES